MYLNFFVGGSPLLFAILGDVVNSIKRFVKTIIQLQTESATLTILRRTVSRVEASRGEAMARDRSEEQI